MGVQINGDTGNVSATKGDYSGNLTIGGVLTYEDVTNVDSVGIITARSGIEIGASPGVGASISVDGNAIFSGITTAATLKATTGIVTTLTATTGIVTSFVTNTAKVGAAVTISESGIEASGIGITCASINGSQIGGRRNIIINGAMQVAQRGTSSTTNGSYTVDRFKLNYSGIDEAPTYAQVAVAAGTTPYTLGFRKAFKLTNGNQTGGAATGVLTKINYLIEARDIANSGWNYLSDTSYITIQFWVKSSVAQNFFARLTSNDGTAQSYVFETGSLSADTWTKIIKTVPGNSSLTFNDDNGNGLLFEFIPFRGTSTTGTRPLNAWAAFDGSTRCPDMTSTWYTTNDSTIELTGVQLEVGSQATPFEHRSYGEEFSLCQRYYQEVLFNENNTGGGILRASSSNNFQQPASIQQFVKMRAAAAGAVISSNSLVYCRRLNGSSSDITASVSHAGGQSNGFINIRLTGTSSGTFTNEEPYVWWCREGDGQIMFSQDAEL